LIPKLLLLPEALADMEQASEWYGSKSPLLRQHFLSDLETRVDRVLAFPESAPIHRGKIRRALLGKFPYGLFYVAGENAIKILAILHLKQDPKKIKSRS
jgi:toxin ParE1/3/4